MGLKVDNARELEKLTSYQNKTTLVFLYHSLYWCELAAKLTFVCLQINKTNVYCSINLTETELTLKNVKVTSHFKSYIGRGGKYTPSSIEVQILV